MNKLAHLLVDGRASATDWLEFSRLYVDFKSEDQESVDSNINKLISNSAEKCAITRRKKIL